MFQNPRRHIEIAKISSRAKFIRIMRNRFKNLVHETKISKIYVPSSSWNRGSIKIRNLNFLRLCPDNRMHSRTLQPTLVRNTRSTTPTKQHAQLHTIVDYEVYRCMCNILDRAGFGSFESSDRSVHMIFSFNC